LTSCTHTDEEGPLKKPFRCVGFAASAVLAVVFTSTLAWSQPWSGVLSPSRAIDWGNAGLPATLPGGETTPNPWTPPTRTKVCATIAPEGTSSAPVAPTDLNTAIQSCPAGQVVELQAGSYYFSDSVNLFCTGTTACALHSVTVRGAGADKTNVYFSSNATLALGGNQDASYFPLAKAPAVGATTVELSAANSEITPGTIIGVTQCSTASSGTTVDSTYGPKCSPTNGLAVYDNGGEFVCNGDGPFCSHGFLSAPSTAAGVEAMQGQVQAVAVTAVSGTTLTVSPPIFLDNLSTANNLAAWDVNPSDSGLGLEDLSLDFTNSAAETDLQFDGCYGCWIKGIRLIAGAQNNQAFVLDGLVQYLVANNYIFSFQSGNYGVLNGSSYGLSNGLVLNNITEHMCGIEWSGTGEVIAYNYSLPEVTENFFSHEGGTIANLLEGNHAIFLVDDGVHGTHDATTLFRNRFDGQAAYLYSANDYLPPVQVGSGTRFENFVANVFGTPGLASSYENGASPIYQLGLISMRGGLGPPLYDPTTAATSLFWGNYDTDHQSVQWNLAEVPSALNTWNGYQQQVGTGDGTTTVFSATLAHPPCQNGDVILGDNEDVFFAYDNGNGGWDPYGVYEGAGTQPVTAGSIDCTSGALSATFAKAPSSGAAIFVNYLQPSQTPSPYRNPVPPQTLPPSFFLPVTSPHPSGGTGLSWWRVCTDYPACSSFSTPPFPAIGPEVSGGPGPGGYAWAIPAEVAYQTLPVDPDYAESVSVSNATWSNTNGGRVTLTLSSTPPLANEGEYHYITAQFKLSGAMPSGYNGTFNVISSSCSGTCTITYALGSNPGTYGGGGTFTWPLVRQFNELVYSLDVAGPDGGVATSDGGPTGDGGGPSETDGGGAKQGNPSSSSGCGCELVGTRSTQSWAFGLSLLGGLALAQRRRAHRI
jgi:hypothetical protein